MGRSLVTRNADLEAPASSGNLPVAPLPSSIAAGIRDLMVAFAAPTREDDDDTLRLLRIYAEAVSGFDVAVVEHALRHLKFHNPRNPFRPTPQDVFEACENIKNYGGATIFPPSAKFAPIAYNTITPAHANLILQKARKHLPEATTADVEEALVEISDAFVAKVNYDMKQSEGVTIKDIITKAVDEIQRKHAYAKQGTPEKVAGGPPPWLDARRSLSDPLIARRVAEDAGLDGYGRQTQAVLQQHIKERRDKEEQRRREEQEAAAEMVERWLEEQVAHHRPDASDEERQLAARHLRKAHTNGWLASAMRGDIGEKHLGNEVEAAFRAARSYLAILTSERPCPGSAGQEPKR